MIPKTYKAAIYKGTGQVEIIEKSLPETCGDNDVIAKNRMATICGADYNAYMGSGDAVQIWKDHEFGHEMVSEVIEVGKNVKGISVGDWIFPNLGYAYHDRSRMATVGGFSEYLYLPDFRLEGDFGGFDQPSAMKLDKSLGLKNLCLLEPFAVGCKAAKSLVGRGTTAVVIGSGIIGMSTALMLKHFGFEKVMLIDFSEFRLENARSYGFLTCNPKKEDLQSKLFETFGSARAYGGEKCGAHCWVDCIGIQPCIDYYTKYGGYGTTLCIVGVHHKPAQFDAAGICYNQQWIKGCGAGTYKEAFDHICDMIRQGTDLSGLISQEFPLEQIEEALKTHGNFEIAQKVAIVYP